MKEQDKELRWFESPLHDGNENSKQNDKSIRVQQNTTGIKPQVNLEKHTAEAYSWLNEIAGHMGARDRLDWAYHALRGVFHALRDRMTPQEVFQLSAQLPLLIRGIYFERYRLTDKPEKIQKKELLNRIEEELGPGNVIQARTAFRAVLKVLYDHVTEGELDDIYATMPTDIKELWDRSLKPITS